ncbi:MAG: hypothetical protein NBV67_10640 [Tagaea sp.]|nr:hypothetical protein [Tagaea sp.]
MIRTILVVILAFWVGAAEAQQAPPRSFADCQKAFDAEMARAIQRTNRDLRQSQHQAGLVRMRCERAVERKQIQDRAKARR